MEILRAKAGKQFKISLVDDENNTWQIRRSKRPDITHCVIGKLKKTGEWEILSMHNRIGLAVNKKLEFMTYSKAYGEFEIKPIKDM